MSTGKVHPKSLNGFKSLFETLYPSLCLFANKYLNDMDTSKDIVQEVFMKIWERDTPYPNFYAIKALLYTSVKNRCLDYLKSKYHRSMVQSPDVDFDHMLSEEFFSTQLTLIDTYAQLATAIQQLPKKSEAVIRLALNAYTNKEIAEELSISKNTVKSQKRIAYKKLRHALGSLLNIL
ncbi:RNA polymerase sigma-70 factor [Winogradskyella undariae]|uniref:RNA polymerase sigma-70 factor n=1 Tax=Winogradskyella undariae TaxID=1285465 RepID=UPI00156B8B53|nr:RNA polymerase sigma-70 factor [Winogradskyella undariae]NRR91207.1 RNA polymerase sigma-70 factor [Winogradskyella undariae]